MSTIKQLARGASAYTQTDESFSTNRVGQRFARNVETSPQAWAPLIDDLLRIRTLKDDWDGEGSPAPHPALVDGAITLAQSFSAGGIPPADRVIAGVNGTIYFEWYTPSGYQEIEVTSPVDAESRWVQTGSNVTEIVRLSLHS